jgi:hypothetical protein
MIISFGYGNEFAGSPEDVLKIADLVEENLTKVQSVYDDGMNYVENENQSDLITLSITNKPIKPYSWHKELIEKRKNES